MNQEGNTPLHIASNLGMVDLVDQLLLSNVDPNTWNKVGETPLHLGAKCNNFDVCLLLLEKGANPHYWW